MQRFFGMMSTTEIEKTGLYNDRYNTRVRVEAGPHGWTVTYHADHTTNYKDVNNSTEENYKEALRVADENVGPLIALNKVAEEYERGEC